MNRDYNKKGSPATSIVQPSSTVFSNPVVYLNNGKPIYGHWKIWTMLLLYGIGLKMEKHGTSFLGMFRLSRYEIHGMKWNWLVLWNQIWLIYVNIWYNMVNSQYMESHYMFDMVNIWILWLSIHLGIIIPTDELTPSFFRGVENWAVIYSFCLARNSFWISSGHVCEHFSNRALRNFLFQPCLLTMLSHLDWFKRGAKSHNRSITSNVGKTIISHHKPSPSHHHLYRWFVHHSQSWVVYDVYGIVLPTL